ncbi:MAG: hypothetical protein HQ536_05220 [Parcubacteria group bacterium]|nr:hypothetical protein [Parcubacteria group bacterium]
MTKTYKGYTIHEADPNASGIHWYSRIVEHDPYHDIDSVTLKADTLTGIKRLITEHKKKQAKYI